MAKPLHKLSLDSRLSAPADSAALARKAVTPVGKTMGDAIDRRSEILKENEALKSRVTELESQDHVVKLDTSLIDESAWANRDDANFAEGNQDFADLKAEIENAGGNVQPIKVRRKGERYEVAFGHRRLRACRELGLPVAAIVEDMDDAKLFVEMDRENRARKNLSAYEQGEMYRKALERKLFASQNQMSKALGVDQTVISRAVQLASLPREIIQAFASKLDLQFRFAAPLAKACAEDRAAAIAQAKEIAKMTRRPAAAAIVDRIVAATISTPAAPATQAGATEIAGGQVRVATDSKGALSLRFAKPLDPAVQKKILDAIEKILG